MAEQLVNVHDLVGRCPFATSQKLLAGKWSLLIMHELSEGPVRFRELERRLHPITQATLTRALRQMEDDGLVHREVYGTIPPKVEYSLTEVGAGFKTVLASLENWGNQYIDYMKSRWPHLRNASGISALIMIHMGHYIFDKTLKKSFICVMNSHLFMPCI